MASSTMEESKLPGGYLVTPRVPQGLAAAVEGLTREVIRHSPEDIYVFAAHHFEKLLLIRERCGPEDITTNRDSNFRTLRDMSQALRMREVDRENTRSIRDPSDHVGWSLNQTAKVLKRHRSIFGDAGRRISTDEVFQMANHKENHTRMCKPFAESNQSRTSVQRREGGCSNENPSSPTTDEPWKASTSRTDRSCSNEDTPEVSETRSGPRMITQIPSLQSSTGLLAKDIKTELRKNRISSRERRNVRAKPEDRSSIDQSDVKQTEKPSGRNVVPRKSSERLKRTETEVEKRNSRSVESTRSSKDRQHVKKTPGKTPGAMSMDRVKDYVVQRFATTKSLEELQDLKYVEKVQEIIDETGPIIKGKVDELRSGMIGRSKRSSWFSDSKNDRLEGPDDSGTDNRSSAGNSSHKDPVESSEALRQSADALRYRLTETQNLLENVSSKMTRPRRSSSARSSRRSADSKDIVISCDLGEDITISNTTILNKDNGLERRLSKTKNLLEDISSVLSGPMRRSISAKNLRRQDDDDLSDLGSRDALKARLDETRNLLEGISATFAMPGHRVGSSKAKRRRAMSNLVCEEMSLSDFQNTSKVSLPAVRSASAKNSSGSVSRSDSDNLVLPAISPEAPKSKKIKEDLVLPALSPPDTGSSNGGSKISEDDIFAEEDIPEIPVEDYIPEAIIEDIFRDSLNVTPDFDSIPQRPDSLEPVETIEDIKDIKKPGNLEGRLQEIQKVEKNIEDLFTLKSSNEPQHSQELGDSGMERKLQELEEAEKRIERIFDSEIDKETEGSLKSETKVVASVDDVDGSSASGRNSEKEAVTGRGSTRGNEGNDKEADEEIKNDKQGSINLPTTSPESLDYTYVLTEGSPYEIPDTVTTVIIPERTVESPKSDRLDVVLEDGEDARLTLVSGDMVSKELNDMVRIYANVDEEIRRNFIEKNYGNVMGKIHESELKLSIDHLNTKKKGPFILPKKESNGDDSSQKNDLDPFGELVEPEPIEFTSQHMDFIRSIESRQEMHISHQDLGRINEEMSEELEESFEVTGKTKQSPGGQNQTHKEPDAEKNIEMGDTAKKINKENITKITGSSDGSILDQNMERDDIKNIDVVQTIETPKIIKVTKEIEKQDALSSESSVIPKEKENNIDETPKRIEATETRKKAVAEDALSNPDSRIINSEREANDIHTSDVDKPTIITESDLSPFRQNLDSSSSNETKESSGLDEPLESAKCANSADEEESSDTRSPESSNEVKETTLTDGLSLSLDPTRPFVPELNLDSLQDITVSSFKMTEDEYENQGHAESANTNSITETLTSDENYRIIENDLPEEAVMEYLVSSSERSKPEEAEIDQMEVAEEPIVKSQIEIKEDVCVKHSAYVTGPDNEEDNFAGGCRESQTVEQEGSGKNDSAKSSTGDEKKEIQNQYKAKETTTTQQGEIENLPVEKVVHEDIAEEKQGIAKVSAEVEKAEIAKEDETKQNSRTEQEAVGVSVAEEVEIEKVLDLKDDSMKSHTVDEEEEIMVEIDEVVKGSKAQRKSQSELEKMVQLTGQNEENRRVPEEEKEVTTQGNKKEKLPATPNKCGISTREKSDAQSVTSGENEEMKEDDSESLGSVIVEDADVGDHKMEDQTTKAEKLSHEDRMVKNKDNYKMSKEETEENNLVDPQEKKNGELAATERGDASTEEKSDARSATSSVEKNEEIKEDDSGCLETAIVKDTEVADHQMEDQITKSGELSHENRPMENENNHKILGEETTGNNIVDFQEKKNEELPATEHGDSSSGEKSDARLATSEVRINEEIKEDDSGSSETAIVEDAELDDHKMSEEETEENNLEDSHEKINGELSAIEHGNASTEEKSDARSETSRVKINEEIKEDDSGSLETAIVGDADVGDHKMEDQETKSADLSCEVKSVEEGSEEEIVEEDTPLAVSRSASQCTTRRVSSGNLAKLREDPTLGWTEESERDIGNEEEGSLSKLKFSKVGGETIKEQGSDEIDQSQDSGSPKNISDDASGSLIKDSKEYHIYVPEVDASENNSTTESSTVDSAVTKIQAGVRGFLTRRRMHRGQHNRSSTLSSIPSIQDSIVGEPYSIDGHQPEVEKLPVQTAEKTNMSSSLNLDEPGLENAATRIQSNYRGYKARKRLRREDAVQRTTFSLEKSFAESGLQHTGEFHDCIPLPLHDITQKIKSSSSNDNKFDSIAQNSLFNALEDKEIISKSKNTADTRKDHDITKSNLEDHSNHGQMFFGQPSNVPIIQFGMIPNIGHLVDLVVLAKEESVLENSYLNFITSVEDTEVIESNPEIKTIGKNFSDENASSETLKRPLAFSNPPVGVIIEEITSSEIESFLNNHPPESEIKGSEVAGEHLGSSNAPCASSETISIEDPKLEELLPEGQMTENTADALKFSYRNGENLVVSEEKMMKDSGIPVRFLSSQEKHLLGPETSVDSMECPIIGSEEKISSRDSENNVKVSRIQMEVGEGSGEEKTIEGQRDLSFGSDVIKENTNEEEPFVPNVDDASSTLSFSLKVEDFLSLGSEDSMQLHRRKPILQVTLTPGDIMKSKSLSQESQLAGERIESPITMVQMAPTRSESLQLEEPSESGCEDGRTIGKSVSTSTEKSGHE